MTSSLSPDAMNEAVRAWVNAGKRGADLQGAIESAITAYLSATGWRTIDSAPKDGTWFLGYDDSLAPEDRVDVWAWVDGRWMNAADSKEFHELLRWQPLPAPPSPTGKEE